MRHEQVLQSKNSKSLCHCGGNSGELRPGSRPKSRFWHIFVSLSRLNRPTAVKFCTGVELSRESRMTV